MEHDEAIGYGGRPAEEGLRALSNSKSAPSKSGAAYIFFKFACSDLVATYSTDATKTMLVQIEVGGGGAYCHLLTGTYSAEKEMYI
ncbi:unnamed protein product [Urochloa humidicola]